MNWRVLFIGKLSKSQIQKAYGVLSELQRFIEGKKALPHLIDASNRFYTFIPHSFGVDNPPVIDNEEMIKVSESKSTKLTFNERWYIFLLITNPVCRQL